MHTVQDQPTIVRNGAPEAVLLRAAAGLRSGAITWGRGWFITPDCGRCAGGAVAWAANPSDIDGDPRYVLGAMAALDRLAVYLVSTGRAQCVPDLDGFMDTIGTVGAYNDAEGRRVAEVIADLEAAAA